LKIGTDWPELVRAFALGTVVGSLYFGGLWWTVRQLPALKRPGLFLLLSLFVRLGVALPLFYLIMDGRWERLLAAVLGFMVVRAFLARRLRPLAGNRTTE
jgi:F1F0 ATPase subunit 2